MDPMHTKTIGAGLIYPLIFLSGFWLSRSGKPYRSRIVTVHKFISLGEVILLYLIARQFQKTSSFNPLELTALLATGVMLVVMIVSGGLLSTNKTMPAILLLVHKAVPYLTLVSSGLLLYLLLNHPLR